VANKGAVFPEGYANVKQYAPKGGKRWKNASNKEEKVSKKKKWSETKEPSVK